jgi:hypothetical protein
MPYVTGFLNVRGRGHPDTGLPEGERPVDPLYGVEMPVFPGNDLPVPPPPPGVWPPPTLGDPVRPATPDVPPGAIWPSPSPPIDWTKPATPEYPSGQPVPPGASTQPVPPPRPSPPATGGQLPSGMPDSKFWVVCGIPGVGWRYVCVDASLRPGNALPPTAEPKAGP